MTHTPGPWTPVLAEGKRGKIGVWEVKSQLDIDQSCFHRSIVSEKAALDEGDAHLIAAAPELLEALKALVDYDTQEAAKPVESSYEAEVIAAAQAAIAKAEGGEK